MRRWRSDGPPVRYRRELSTHQPGGHLWASFGTHFRGGCASMVPALALFMVSQPLGSSMTFLVLTAFTVLPIAIALVASGWALISTALLYRMRFRDRLPVQLTVYALTFGALALVLSVTGLWWTHLRVEGSMALWESAYFLHVVGGGLLLGLVGAVVGRLSMERYIRWHEWAWRAPLRDVFAYVDGKHDRAEFARMTE